VLSIGQYGFGTYAPGIAVIEIAGIETVRRSWGNETKYRLKDGDLLPTYGVHLYAHDDNVKEAFAAMRAEYETKKAEYDAFMSDWNDRWEEARLKLTPLSPEDIEAMRRLRAARPE